MNRISSIHSYIIRIAIFFSKGGIEMNTVCADKYFVLDGDNDSFMHYHLQNFPDERIKVKTKATVTMSSYYPMFDAYRFHMDLDTLNVIDLESCYPCPCIYRLKIGLECVFIDRIIKAAVVSVAIGTNKEVLLNYKSAKDVERFMGKLNEVFENESNEQIIDLRSLKISNIPFDVLKDKLPNNEPYSFETDIWFSKKFIYEANTYIDVCF